MAEKDDPRKPTRCCHTGYILSASQFYEESLKGQHPSIPKSWRLVAATPAGAWINLWFQDSVTASVYQRHAGLDTAGYLLLERDVNLLEAK